MTLMVEKQRERANLQNGIQVSRKGAKTQKGKERVRMNARHTTENGRRSRIDRNETSFPSFRSGRCRPAPRALLVRSIERGRGTRRKGTTQTLRRPRFTLVDGCSSVSVAVPNSLTHQAAILSDLTLHMSLGIQQIGRKAVPFRN